MGHKNLRDLYGDQLRDLYSAETQFSDVLTSFHEQASSNDLKVAIGEHSERMKGQLSRLDQLMKSGNIKRDKATCEGMGGILEEGQRTVSECDEGPVRDAAMISCIQRANHYEMAGYGTARSYANVLGDSESGRLLQQSLDEESQTDTRMTRIAESHINVDARQR